MAKDTTVEQYELKHWSKKFHVTQEEVKSAIEAVGASEDKIKQYLKSQK